MSTQSCQAPHRRYLRSGLLILLAALVAIATGCASLSEETQTGAGAGAGAGVALATFCGPLVVVCAVPLAVAGGVAGGVAGATVHAVKDAAKPSSTPPSSTPPRIKHPSFVTRLPGSDFSPSGDLLIDNSDIRESGSHEFSGTLVVNLDKPLDDSTKSIEEDIIVVCTTGEVSFHWRRSYDDLNGSGNILTSEEASVPIPPGLELDAVKRSFCGASSNA